MHNWRTRKLLLELVEGVEGDDLDSLVISWKFDDQYQNSEGSRGYSKGSSGANTRYGRPPGH